MLRGGNSNELVGTTQSVPGRITFAISQGNAAVINSEEALVLIAPSGSNEAVTLHSIKWSSAGAFVGTKLGVLHLPEGASGLGRLSFAGGTSNVVLEVSGRDRRFDYGLRVDNAGDAEICRPLVINGSRFLEVSHAIYRPEDVLDVLSEGGSYGLSWATASRSNLVTNSIGSTVKLGLSRLGAGCLVDVVQIDGAGGAGVASFAIGRDLEPHAVSAIVPIKGLVENLFWISPDGELIVWELRNPYLRRVVTRFAEWILRAKTTRRHRFALCARDGRLIGYLTQPVPTGLRPEILWARIRMEYGCRIDWVYAIQNK